MSDTHPTKDQIERGYALAKQGVRQERIEKETGLDPKQIKELIQKARRS